MKFDYISDIHIDWYRATHVPAPTIEYLINTKHSSYDQDSHILIVAGDISDNINEGIEWLKSAKQYYKHVIFVDGNHDFYCVPGETIKNPVRRIRLLQLELHERLKQLNVTYLRPPNGLLEIDDFIFIGCNGWYDFRAIPHLVDASIFRNRFYNGTDSKDQRRLQFIQDSSDSVESLAKSDAMTLEDMIVRVPSGRRIIVVTHTPPSIKSMELGVDKWGPDPTYGVGNFGSGYMQLLLEQYGSKLTAWFHGHEHYVRDYREHGCRILANARGFPWDGSMERYIKSVRL